VPACDANSFAFSSPAFEHLVREVPPLEQLEYFERTFHGAGEESIAEEAQREFSRRSERVEQPDERCSRNYG
jgi:hypothetical protein